MPWVSQISARLSILWQSGNARTFLIRKRALDQLKCGVTSNTLLFVGSSTSTAWEWEEWDAECSEREHRTGLEKGIRNPITFRQVKLEAPPMPTLSQYRHDIISQSPSFAYQLDVLMRLLLLSRHSDSHSSQNPSRASVITVSSLGSQTTLTTLIFPSPIRLPETKKYRFCSLVFSQLSQKLPSI